MKTSNWQKGATLPEFIIAAPLVMIIGMTTVQAGLIYHGKTTLNYAAFEAARAGAVNNAQLSVIRDTLGVRLAPVQGGDGSAKKAAIAIAKSALSVKDPLNTRVEVLNPTTAAFEDWGVNSQTANQRVIPNNHLRHKEHTVGTASGLSLRDANLLKIQVTYGIDMKIPVVSGIIARSMVLIDPTNAHYYIRNKFPVSSVATVRMQSEAWEGEIMAASAEVESAKKSDAAAPVVHQPVEFASREDSAGATTGTDGADANTTANTDDETGAAGEAEQELSQDPDSQADSQSGLCDQDLAGLGDSPELLQSSVYDEMSCSAMGAGYGESEGLASAEGGDPSTC